MPCNLVTSETMNHAGFKGHSVWQDCFNPALYNIAIFSGVQYVLIKSLSKVENFLTTFNTYTQSGHLPLRIFC